jgi:hypothetical protein
MREAHEGNPHELVRVTLMRATLMSSLSNQGGEGTPEGTTEGSLGY